MGGNNTKRRNHNEHTNEASQVPVQGKRESLQFGEETEFWFVINARAVDCAKSLHAWIAGELKAYSLQIQGVKYLDEEEGARLVQALVYCKDIETAKNASRILAHRVLSGHRIATSCMPESESKINVKDPYVDNVSSSVVCFWALA